MRFRILGPLIVSDDYGAELRVPQPMQRALLCTLLLHQNQVIRASRLAGLLWGADIPGSGPGALRTHVWAARRVLAPAKRLHKGAHGYRLEVRHGELDLDNFRELAELGGRGLAENDPRGAARLLSQALRLWREPPLADIPATPGLRAITRRLLDERQVTSEVLTDARLLLGQSSDLVPELRAQAAANPAHERVWGQLMLALYRCGRRAEALAAFTDARAVLAGQYGIEPGPVLQRLQRQILADDPALAEPAAAQPARYRFAAGTPHLVPISGLRSRQAGPEPEPEPGDQMIGSWAAGQAGGCYTAQPFARPSSSAALTRPARHRDQDHR
jgi:DNA-binding SARP family transcriptional activator